MIQAMSFSLRGGRCGLLGQLFHVEGLHLDSLIHGPVADVPEEQGVVRIQAAEVVVVEELLTLDFITLQRPSAVRLMMEEELARSGRKLDVALESHQLVTVGRMVASGLGGSAVPALCETQMAALGAVCIPLPSITILMSSIRCFELMGVPVLSVVGKGIYLQFCLCGKQAAFEVAFALRENL